MLTRLLRRPSTWAAVAAVALAAAFGRYWFQPWKLVTDTEVHETPTAFEDAGRGPGASGAAADAPAAAGVVSRGEFVTHEHETSGTARIVRGADGRHRLELVGLDTSTGPDLHVRLTDQPVRTGPSGWNVFDDGRRVGLGPLKGNRGDQAYEIPAGTGLAGLTSVSIWCERFAVSFGAASLTPVG